MSLAGGCRLIEEPERWFYGGWNLLRRALWQSKTWLEQERDMTGRVITHCRPWHPSPESRSETPITPQRSLSSVTTEGGVKYTQYTSHKKRQAAGVPAWNCTEKHSFEIHKWIRDNARMRTSPVALALMLTEWPAEVKEGFIKMKDIIRFMLLWLFLVRSLLGRSDSFSPQTGSVGLTVLSIAHRIQSRRAVDDQRVQGVLDLKPRNPKLNGYFQVISY